MTTRSLVALNKKTGREIWRSGIPESASAEMSKKGSDGASLLVDCHQ